MENKGILLLDTNILLRYFLKDNETMFRQARRIIDENSCIVLPSILQEVMYVLSGPVYQIPRELIAEAVKQSFADIFYTEHEIIEQALEFYIQTPEPDFPDCLLLAYHDICSIDVATFDQKLNKKLEKSFSE